MNIERILDYLENIIQEDCDICPCNTVCGDRNECSKLCGESCREAIERDLIKNCELQEVKEKCL